VADRPITDLRRKGARRHPLDRKTITYRERGKLPAEAGIAFGLTTIVKPFEPRIFTCQRAPAQARLAAHSHLPSSTGLPAVSFPAGQLKLDQATRNHQLSFTGGGEVYRPFFCCQAFFDNFFSAADCTREQEPRRLRPIHLSAPNRRLRFPRLGRGEYTGSANECKRWEK
jgi:hypothetical protein